MPTREISYEVSAHSVNPPRSNGDGLMEGCLLGRGSTHTTEILKDANEKVSDDAFGFDING